MKRSGWFLTLACGLAMTAACAASAHAVVPCEEMTKVPLQGGTITAASLVGAGQFAPAPGNWKEGWELFPKLPAFCRVEATLRLTNDSAIRIEVWMPESGWNGKLVEGGNAAYMPDFSYGIMAQALLEGYAATSSNTGHEGASAAFALDHPQKLIDWAYRAVHENAIAAKAIVEAHYGDASRRAYFDGCSTGGRQALGEAQRYPADFNGIVDGDPGINLTHQTAGELWTTQQAHRAPGAEIPASKFAMIHAAALAACDTIDGVKDGVIENPLQCHFDPGTLLCKGADGPDCLTAAQVQTARDTYRGARNASGKQIFPGLMPGSEMGWKTLDGPKPMGYALDSYRYMVMKNPKWDYVTLNLDRDVPDADKTVASLVNNADPNLKLFFARGGKLIGYHGWADPGISPFNSINYYKSVAKAMGGEKTLSNDYRLFLVPGMLHCGGGDGTSHFDMLTALNDWVTTGKAPASIPASRIRNGNVDRTRPLCPYPQQAVYKGTGSTDEATNFMCAVK